MRVARLSLLWIALVVGLTGCDGDSDASGSGTATADFCDSFNDLFEQVLGTDARGSAATVRAFKDWATDMEDLDAPADMPDDAQHGFELFLDQARSIDDDASLEDLEKLGEGLSDADRAAGDAFSDWATDNCPLDLPAPASP